MCGAAAKADIRLLSESNVGTKMHLSVMTANLLPASAGKEASPCLCVWGCCVWFPSDKNNADCPLCHLVAGKVVEVANEIHRRSGIYLNRCQSAYPGSNLRQQSFHLYLFPWQSYSLPWPYLLSLPFPWGVRLSNPQLPFHSSETKSDLKKKKK